MSGFRRFGLGCAAVVVALVAGQGCAMAVYQDARMVGKGKVELMPTVTRMGISEGGDTEAVGNLYGGVIIAGITDKVDFSAGYARFDCGRDSYSHAPSRV